MIETVLYTQEIYIFRSGLTSLSSDPINVYIDKKGHVVVADGNHRAYMALISGGEIEMIEIGKLEKDVSCDPCYRLVENLKVLDC